MEDETQTWFIDAYMYVYPQIQILWSQSSLRLSFDLLSIKNYIPHGEILFNALMGPFITK